MSYIKDFLKHKGHPIVVAEYGKGVNASIECEKCHEVLIDSEAMELYEELAKEAGA